MKLHIAQDSDGTSVWVEGVPADTSDSEVQAAFEAAGGPVFQRAAALIGRSTWIHLNSDAAAREVRVYADR